MITGPIFFASVLLFGTLALAVEDELLDSNRDFYSRKLRGPFNPQGLSTTGNDPHSLLQRFDTVTTTITYPDYDDNVNVTTTITYPEYDENQYNEGLGDYNEYDDQDDEQYDEYDEHASFETYVMGLVGCPDCSEEDCGSYYISPEFNLNEDTGLDDKEFECLSTCVVERCISNCYDLNTCLISCN